MEQNRHLEAILEQLLNDLTDRHDAREVAAVVSKAITTVLEDEQAEEWASVLDDAMHRYERRQSGEADSLAEGPGRSGSAI